MRERRRTFGPVVLLGLAVAALGAVAAARPWLDVQLDRTSGAASAPFGSSLSLTTAQESPLAAALALVVLACWGVVLVTRGRFRRVVAVLGAGAALGFAVSVVSAPWLLREDLTAELRRLTGGSATSELTPWWWVALLVSLPLLATTAGAALLVRDWPEMGTRYDAPTTAPGDAGPGRGGRRRTTGTDNIDLWNALDEGHDPTA